LKGRKKEKGDLGPGRETAAQETDSAIMTCGKCLLVKALSTSIRKDNTTKGGRKKEREETGGERNFDPHVMLKEIRLMRCFSVVSEKKGAQYHLFERGAPTGPK